MTNELVLILDFGSRYTQQIARATRRLGVYSEIVPYNIDYGEIIQRRSKALILSDSTDAVYEGKPLLPDRRILDSNLPILGINNGNELLHYWFGEPLVKKKGDEEALLVPKSAAVNINNQNLLFEGLSNREQVWMDDNNSLTELPADFTSIAFDEHSHHFAIAHNSKPQYLLQFHPESSFTSKGDKILNNFLKKIASFKGDWNAATFIENCCHNIKKEVGDKKVLLALSGGVDSSVTAALLDKAIGKNLVAVYVDTGLMRKNETQEIEELFSSSWSLEFITIDAKEEFYQKLKGVVDPEEKRKIIGNTFIEIFEREALNHPDIEFLAQGTLYPDVIESISVKGSKVAVKSHHNVGGLPEKMNLKIVEPLRELFKDEVREVGKQLGLPANIIGRHPFPGPGLAIRILGEVNPEKVKILQEIDYIFIDELKKNNLYNDIWQAFSVLLPIKSVGVTQNERTYQYVCALRAVTSIDGMTAEWAELPTQFLRQVSDRIIDEVPSVNRVVYDISSKPPATIEWE